MEYVIFRKVVFVVKYLIFSKMFFGFFNEDIYLGFYLSSFSFFLGYSVGCGYGRIDFLVGYGFGYGYGGFRLFDYRRYWIFDFY